MGHFYSIRDGVVYPQYEVKGKNGKLRPATIKDARENNWLPSVNEILQIQSNPSLNDWIERQCFSFTFDEFISGQIDSSNPEKLKKSLWDKWKTSREKYASRGTEIHDLVIERGIKAGEQIADEAAAKALAHFKTLYPQHSFGESYSFGEFGQFGEGAAEACIGSLRHGYAGRIDLLARHKHDRTFHLVDFKFTKADREAYTKEYCQIAAYRQLLEQAYGWEIQSAELLLYSQETGEFRGRFNLEDHGYGEALDEFEACFNLWRLSKRHDPRIAPLARSD